MTSDHWSGFIRIISVSRVMPAFCSSNPSHVVNVSLHQCWPVQLSQPGAHNSADRVILACGFMYSDGCRLTLTKMSIVPHWSTADAINLQCKHSARASAARSIQSLAKRDDSM